MTTHALAPSGPVSEELRGGGARGPSLIRTIVVDDDFRVASIQAAYVDRIAGFVTIAQAHSAAAALDAVERLHPDLLLLDLYLPDQHGLELLRQLRASGPAEVDVIVVTAANDVASVRSAMQGGAVHYLLKPFDFTVLEQKLLAYQAMRSHIASIGEADQSRVDRLFRGLTGPPAPGQAGHTPHTLQAIESLLEDSGEGLSATDVAQRLGVSRATAQRYLARLEVLGRVTMSPRYGVTGRPEHRYRRSSTPR